MEFESWIYDVSVRIPVLYEHPGREMTSDKVQWFEKSGTLFLFPAATYYVPLLCARCHAWDSTCLNSITSHNSPLS